MIEYIAWFIVLAFFSIVLAALITGHYAFERMIKKDRDAGYTFWAFDPRRYPKERAVFLISGIVVLALVGAVVVVVQ